MKLKLGLIVGFVVGYLLGTKAGRERYDQIMKTLNKIGQSEPAQRARAQATDLVDQAKQRFREPAADDIDLRTVTLP